MDTQERVWEEQCVCPGPSPLPTALLQDKPPRQVSAPVEESASWGAPSGPAVRPQHWPWRSSSLCWPHPCHPADGPPTQPSLCREEAKGWRSAPAPSAAASGEPGGGRGGLPVWRQLRRGVWTAGLAGGASTWLADPDVDPHHTWRPSLPLKVPAFRDVVPGEEQMSPRGPSLPVKLGAATSEDGGRAGLGDTTLCCPLYHQPTASTHLCQFSVSPVRPSCCSLCLYPAGHFIQRGRWTGLERGLQTPSCPRLLFSFPSSSQQTPHWLTAPSLSFTFPGRAAWASLSV